MQLPEDPTSKGPPNPGLEAVVTQDKESPNPAFRLVQLLVDPRGLQLLMLAGSSLLALGLVLWLAVKGVFDNPLNAAFGLGAANFALLGGGLWLAMKTRHQLAGRAVSMLACALLPLNLWFYDTQGLITLAEGGNLWLPALACCAVYAGVARLLKDSLFVYAFAGGVAMTGLVFLAGGEVARFWEVLAPSTLLVSLGVGCIHVERLFPEQAKREEDHVFTRGDFGRAFFRAGHVLLGSGLAVLMGGRVVGRFYEMAFAGWFPEQPHVATLMNAQLAAFALALAGAYAYAYSRLVGGHGRYALFSLLALAWSALIGLDLLGVPFTEVLLVGLLGAVAVACRMAEGLFAPRSTTKPAVSQDALAQTGRVAGVSAVVLLAAQLVRGAWSPWLGVFAFDFTWGYVAAGLVALAAAVSAVRRQPSSTLAWTGFGVAGVSVAAGLVSVVPFTAELVAAWRLLAALTVPAGMLVWTKLRGDAESREAHLTAAEASAGLVAALLTPLAALSPSVATLAATLAVAVLVGAVAVLGARRTAGGFAACAALGACWQAMVVYSVSAHAPLLLVTVASVAAVAAERFGLARGLAGAGRLGVCVAALAGALFAGNKMLASEADLKLLGMLAAQATLTAVSGSLSRRDEGRHGLLGLAVGQVALSGVVLNVLSVLTFAQRMEVFLAAVGAGLVVAGLVGWRREATDPSDGDPSFTDVNLWLGSLMMVTPLSLGLLGVRLYGGAPAWVVLHEVGVLAAGLALVAVGVLCRLRATTLTGLGALAVYVLSLFTLVHLPDQLQSVAFYLMAGGGGLFGAAVLLSVYRDRLMQLPDRVREGRGVFAVLKWR